MEYNANIKQAELIQILEKLGTKYTEAVNTLFDLELDSLQIYDLVNDHEIKADDNRFDDPLFWIYLGRDLDNLNTY